MDVVRMSTDRCRCGGWSKMARCLHFVFRSREGVQGRRPACRRFVVGPTGQVCQAGVQGDNVDRCYEETGEDLRWRRRKADSNTRGQILEIDLSS